MERFGLVVRGIVWGVVWVVVVGGLWWVVGGYGRHFTGHYIITITITITISYSITITSDVVRSSPNIYDRLSHRVIEYSISYLSYRETLWYLRKKKQKCETSDLNSDTIETLQSPRSSTAPESGS